MKAKVRQGPSKEFIRDRCAIGEDFTVTLKDFFHEYIGWCVTCGFQVMPKTKLKKELMESGITVRRGNYNRLTLIGIKVEEEVFESPL